MAHFAQLDENNIVQQVIVVADEYSQTEEAGQDFIKNTLRLDGVWKKTSYNTFRDYRVTVDENDPLKIVSVEHLGSKHRLAHLGGVPFRGQYASIGDKYDLELDEFVTPQ